MPKKNGNNIEENEDYKYSDVVEDEDFKEEVLKDEAVEKKAKKNSTYYFTDEYNVYTGNEEQFNSLGKYEKYAKYANDDEEHALLSNSGEFIKVLGLEKGNQNVYVRPGKFNEAFHKTMAVGFRFRDKTIIKEDNNTKKNNDYLTSKVKGHFNIDNLDKNSIISYAKAKRAECFSFLVGETPNQSNPFYVTQCKVSSSKGTHNKLAYDYNAIQTLVDEFETDEELYKSAIAHVDFNHFRKAYNNMNAYLNAEGKEVFGRFQEGYDATTKYIDTYCNLREIHNSRPWYYPLIHPSKYYDEYIVLGDYKNYLLGVAKDTDIDDIVSDALEAKTYSERKKAYGALKTAFLGEMGVENLTPAKDLKVSKEENINDQAKEKLEVKEVAEELDDEINTDSKKEEVEEFDLSEDNESEEYVPMGEKY